MISQILNHFLHEGQKGTGLGLAVIWGIIDNHNGTINVESEEGKVQLSLSGFRYSEEVSKFMSNPADILVIDDEQ